MKKIKFACALFLLSTLAPLTIAQLCVYNSGGEIIYNRNNDNCWIEVRDGPGEPTCFTMISPAVVNGNMTVIENSKLIVNAAAQNGGTVRGSLIGRDNATITLNSGSYHNIYMSGTSALDHRGEGNGEIRTSDLSSMIMSGGGQAAFIRAFNDSSIEVNGGKVLSYVLAANDSKIALNEGTYAYNPTGGAYVRANNDSELFVTGGNFILWSSSSGNRVKFQANHNGIIKFVGSTFFIGGEPVVGLLDLEELANLGRVSKSVGATATTYSGIVSGKLKSGHNINNEFYITRNLNSSESANFYFYPESCLANDELAELLELTVADLLEIQEDLVACQVDVTELQANLIEANNEITNLSTENQNLFSLLIDPKYVTQEAALQMRVYAREKVDEAVDAGGNQRDIDKALDSIAKGDRHRADGDYDKATDSFMRASVYALDAIGL